MRLIKKWMHRFDDLDELYHSAKFGEDCTMRAGCRCENVVFCFFWFVCHATSPEHRAFEGCIVRTIIALPLLPDFDEVYRIFSKENALSEALLSSHIFC